MQKYTLFSRNFSKSNLLKDIYNEYSEYNEILSDYNSVKRTSDISIIPVLTNDSNLTNMIKLKTVLTGEEILQQGETEEKHQIITNLNNGLKLIDNVVLSPDLGMVKKYKILENPENVGKSFDMLVNDFGYIFIDFPFEFLPQNQGVRDNVLQMKNLYHSIQNVLTEFNSLEQKGFLNVTDLNHKEFTFIQPYLQSLFKYKVNQDKKWVKNTDIKPGKQTIESYKWTFNFIMLNLYYWTLVGIRSLEGIDLQGNESIIDFQSDLITLNKILYSKIDPSLRNEIQKRGVTLFQNINTGFDTEYQNLNTTTNTLLSVQLAVNTHTLLKIPVRKGYALGTIGSLNQEIYNKTWSGQESYNFDKVEKSLNELIQLIRKVRFNNHDQIVEVLIEGLKQKGYKYFEKDNYYIFSMPITSMEKYIYYNDEGKGYTLKEMVNQSNLIGESQLNKSYTQIISDLSEIFTSTRNLVEDREIGDLDFDLDLDLDSKIVEDIFTLPTVEGQVIVDAGFTNLSDLNPSIKKISRQYMNNFTSDKISVTKYKTNYFIGHLTQADLSILNDFELFKENLDIVNKSFITLGKSFQYQNSNIQIRDTMLLAPGGSKSLANIGRLYGEAFKKIELTKDEITNMKNLLKDNKAKFQEYALRDAEITLIHALWTEHFNFSIKEIGIPITLSSLGSKYVKYHWKKIMYNGYQIHPKHLIGDANAIQTPIGLFNSPNIGFKLSLFIGNYKGGRNESFMYGVDKNTFWIDYDLISAYTTILSEAGDPLYEKGRALTPEDLKELSDDELLFSYTIIKGNFIFPENVKYPSIPCYVNETTTVYPLQGNCILTGSEYFLALKQGCKIKVEECYHVPFSKGIKPFENIIKNIQTLRRKYNKGTISNLFYKEMGNSIYGNIVKGMSDKRKFDIKTNKSIRMDASSLSNPLIASWTTAFIRSIIGECLHGINLINGKVVSVTTDGFITDVSELEDKLTDNLSNFEVILLKKYKSIRIKLSDNDKALEIKTEGKGIISWTTRGQLGLESQIKATTGYQSRTFSNTELAVIFLDRMSSGEKYFEYVQFSLRSAKEIYLKGGHVTPVYRDQIFRLHFDNRRKILLDDNLKEKFDWSNILLDSIPVKNVVECDTLRFLSKLHKTRIYNKNLNVTNNKSIKNYEVLAIRNFIKVYYNKPTVYGLRGDEFKSYADIIFFIHKFNPKIKISKSSISNLKTRKLILKPTPRLKETLSFGDYIKINFPEFKLNNFFEK